MFYQRSWQEADREQNILLEFFHYLKDRNVGTPINGRGVYIGHNIADFDLRFLWQRSVINGIQLHHDIPCGIPAWSERIFDTMQAWAGRGNRVSLDKLCRAFGVSQKGSEIGEQIDGSKVWDFVQAGKIDLVAKYCGADVERARELHKRMTFCKSEAVPSFERIAA